MANDVPKSLRLKFNVFNSTIKLLCWLHSRRLLLPIKFQALSMTHAYPTILLADDDPDDRDFFCSAMRRLYPKVNVRTFEDGDPLLNYLYHCGRPLFPLCILLDYKMPRLNAPQFLQATGEGTPYIQIPKIVWSTSHRKKDMDECLNLGAASFLIKPTTDYQLEQEIRSLTRYILIRGMHNASASRWPSAFPF